MHKIQNSKSGFTIVELLIVIVVIAILAAISIVAYNGIQNRANDSAVQSDLRQAYISITDYNLKNSAYPSGGTELQATKITPSRSSYDTSINNLYYCKDNASNNFILVAQSKSTNRFFISSANTTVSPYSGAWAAGVCDTAGYTSGGTPSAGHTVGGGWTFWVN